MIQTIFLWIGYGTAFASSLIFIGFLCYIGYLIQDIYFKKLMGWSDVQVRQDILFFVNHRRDVFDYVRKQERKRKKKVNE